MTIIVLGCVFWAFCKLMAFLARGAAGMPLDENTKILTKEYDAHTNEYYEYMQKKAEEEQKQYDDWGFVE